MNILGIGIDVVEVDRFKSAVERHGKVFLNKIFTEKELEYADQKKGSFMHMAGKFAAKEAVKKALPDGANIGLSWPDIEILNDKDGKPYVILHGHAKSIVEEFNSSQVFVSISHTESIATSNAMVVNNGA